MKYLITATLFFIYLSTIAQETNFNKGYKEGFKEGYCYQEIGCIPPIPPIPPMPSIIESSTSYKDGYNRGFLAGKNKKEEDERKKRQSGYSNNTNSAGRQWQSTEYQSMFDDNFLSLYTQALQIRQQQQKQQYAELVESARRQKEIELQKTINNTNKTLNLYSSLKSKAIRVADGWHNVVSLDRVEFCGNRLVRVENNKIVEYFKDSYKWANQISENKIIAGGIIDSAKTILKMIPFEESNESSAVYVEIFFIDYLLNTNSRAQAPIKTGTVSFWSDQKRGGAITINFGGYTLDKLTNYFKDGTPSCEDEGTVSIEVIPGNYSFVAKSEKGSTWRGTIFINSGECKTFKLSK